MNLESTEYGGNKGYCEDLTEGKFSFPVVHAVRNSEGDRQILSKSGDTPSMACNGAQCEAFSRHTAEENTG
jgi:hypothetical protein